jgi:hypothetical protein
MSVKNCPGFGSVPREHHACLMGCKTLVGFTEM